ncbi:unnamed protein product [Amoebophrya sp. A120]|nr:unnamed protein product [Amoebophrya sp. A120]|eukprot:GSA120T00003354001.1
MLSPQRKLRSGLYFRAPVALNMPDPPGRSLLKAAHDNTTAEFDRTSSKGSDEAPPIGASGKAGDTTEVLDGDLLPRKPGLLQLFVKSGGVFCATLVSELRAIADGAHSRAEEDLIKALQEIVAVGLLHDAQDDLSAEEEAPPAEDHSPAPTLSGPHALQSARHAVRDALVTRVTARHATRGLSLRREKPLARLVKPSLAMPEEEDEIGFNTPNLLQLDFARVLQRFVTDIQTQLKNMSELWFDVDKILSYSSNGSSVDADDAAMLGVNEDSDVVELLSSGALDDGDKDATAAGADCSLTNRGPSWLPPSTPSADFWTLVVAVAQTLFREAAAERLASLYLKLLLLNRGSAYDPSTQGAYHDKIHHDIHAFGSCFADCENAVNALYDMHEIVGCEYVMVPMVCVRLLTRYAGLTLRDVEQVLRFHPLRDKTFVRDLKQLMLQTDEKRKLHTTTSGDGSIGAEDGRETHIWRGGVFDWVHTPFWWNRNIANKKAGAG